MRRTALGLVAVLVSFPVTQVAAQAPERDSLVPLNWPQELPQEIGSRPSTVSRIATGIGGALLGAGLGFFASQVVQGDWQDDAAQRPINRSLWTVIGGSVGLTFGVRFPLSGGGQGLSRGGLPTGRAHLGASELSGLGIDHALQAVESLRPEWLLIRGNRSLTASVDPVAVDGTGGGVRATGSTPLINESGTIQVYIDGVRAGGIGALGSVSLLRIRDIYFFDAAAATVRWGSGNPHGAILVIT